ncbi:MAG: hypothetical protein BWY78_01078 [Alphaproteobacteria bacterium ADurb.Bin438]|nr:MAG: hypothetical protein BWY78_01078 [Alphaproteobacteria bacterium ADurb.Bin438]
MRNISSYLTIGLLLSFNSYAFEIMNNPNSVELAFNNIKPELTIDNSSLTGFSGLFNEGQGLDVTHNQVSFSQPKPNDEDKEKIATVDEPIVINEWKIKVKDEIEDEALAPVKKEVVEQIIEQALNKKEQEIIFKENNLNEENPVVFSDMSYIQEKTTSFAFNGIKEDEKRDEIKLDENASILNGDELQDIPDNEGIGIININEPKIDKSTLPNKKDLVSSTKSNESIWSIATVRGKASNRFATIGSTKDSNEDLKNDEKSNSLNPWATGFKENSSNTQKTTDNKSFSPPQKINQWSVRGGNDVVPEIESLIDTSFLENNSTSKYDNRWTNHQRAVLINNITSKPLYKKNDEDTSLKDDEANPYFEPEKPKKLLTKIEDKPINGLYEDNTENDTEYNTVNTSNIASYSPLKTSHIGLNEIRLNFRPNFADLSLQSVKLVGNFASRIANTPNSVIEVRMSDKAYNLQTNRATIVKQILNSNGISDDRINIVTTDRDVDTMVLRVIIFNKKKVDLIEKAKENEVKSW